MRLPLLLVLCLTFLGLGSAQGQQAPYVIPDFTFYRLDGSPFRKEHLSRQNTIVFVFFSTTCHHCQDETLAMGKNYSRFSQASLYFVSREGKQEIEQFMNTYGKELRNKANVMVLQDPRSEFVLKFNPSKFPSVYVYTPARHLIKHFDGETPIEEIIAAVN